MSATIDIKQLTTPEKLRLMEALWQELSDVEVPSPDWHADILTERDDLLRSGKEGFVDWEAAKRELRQELQ